MSNENDILSCELGCNFAFQGREEYNIDLIHRKKKSKVASPSELKIDRRHQTEIFGYYYEYLTVMCVVLSIQFRSLALKTIILHNII